MLDVLRFACLRAYIGQLSAIVAHLVAASDWLFRDECSRF